MNPQTSTDLQQAAHCIRIALPAHEVQLLETSAKFRVRGMKGRYFKAEVTEISEKEYYEGCGDYKKPNV